MKRVVIIFLVFLLSSVVGKIQGNNFLEYHFFPLASKLVDIFPGYLARNCERIALIGLALTILSLEIDYVKENVLEIKIATWLIIGRWIDYLLESNKGWFLVYGQVISYDTFAVLVYSITLIVMLIKKK